MKILILFVFSPFLSCALVLVSSLCSPFFFFLRQFFFVPSQKKIKSLLCPSKKCVRRQKVPSVFCPFCFPSTGSLRFSALLLYFYFAMLTFVCFALFKNHKIAMCIGPTGSVCGDRAGRAAGRPGQGQAHAGTRGGGSSLRAGQGAAKEFDTSIWYQVYNYVYIIYIYNILYNINIIYLV